MSYEIPADFDEFWKRTREEADSVAVACSRRPTAYQPLATHRVELLSMQGIAGELQGWIAVPTEGDSAPAFLWIPAYGRESHLPNEYSTRPGMVSMSINFFGHAAFHQEEYRPERGYFADGVADPETWVFRRMAQDCLIAMRVLQAQPEADGGRLAVAGLSQGGGMAIWTGVNSLEPKRVVADLPFLSDMGNVLTRDVYRYPLKELGDFSKELPGGMDQILRTVSYFDTAHQATRLRLPTLVSLGEKDPAVRPDTVRTVYANLAAEDKKLIEYPTGHDWNPEMLENNREFLAIP